jgi:Tol biopolymer transport system component
MKRIWIVLMILIGIMMLIQGCTKYSEYEEISYTAPNWASDGKIVFVKDHNIVRVASGWMGAEEDNVKGSKEFFTLCEINNDGTGYKEISQLLESENYARSLRITNTSSAEEWVVLGMRAEDEGELHIYTIKRDGSSLHNTRIIGTSPDFSPDAEKIVYEKKDEGIWIMNRDGSGDHQITSEGQKPAWAPDGGRIVYVLGNLYLTDSLGTIIDSFLIRTRGNPPDWGPIDSNAVCISNGFRGSIIYMETGKVDTLENIIVGDAPIFWSPNGSQFIAYY